MCFLVLAEKRNNIFGEISRHFILIKTTFFFLWVAREFFRPIVHKLHHNIT